MEGSRPAAVSINPYLGFEWGMVCGVAGALEWMENASTIPKFPVPTSRATVQLENWREMSSGVSNTRSAPAERRMMCDASTWTSAGVPHAS